MTVSQTRKGRCSVTIQQLEYILEVNRCGTIAQAAKNLYVTHACVGNAIRALEEELGFAVFERSWHGVVPTPQGLKALEHARAICEHQKLLMQSAQEVRSVHIETGFNVLFADVFLRLMKEYRGRTDIVFCHRQNRSSDVSDGQSVEDRLLAFETDLFVDFIQGEGSQLTVRKRAARQKGVSLQLRGAVPAAVYVGAGHPLYQKADLQLSDLEQDCLVDTPKALLAKSGMIRRKLGFSPARTLRASESRTRWELVAAGCGFYFGPQLLDDRVGELTFRRIPVPGFQYHLAAITNPARPLSPEAQRYLDLLDEQIVRIRV